MLTAALLPLIQRPCCIQLLKGSKRRFCQPLLVLLLFPFLASAQTVKADSLPRIPSALYTQYMQGVGGASILFSGAEYEGAYPLIQGSPFLDDSSFRPGTICYEGVDYFNIPLAYDLVRNEVLTKSFQQLNMRLEKAKVCSFRIGGHHYVRPVADSSSGTVLPDDFYDLLLDGEMKVYAKRLKTVVRALHADSQDRIAEQTAYYLYKDHQYFRVSKARDFLRLFPNQKSQLKTFWKTQAPDFKKDPETFILQTLSYWMQIKK